MTFCRAILLLVGTLIAAVAAAEDEAATAGLRLPPGFAISVWSDEVPDARSMALGDDGTVFVSTRRDGRVYALRPRGDSPPERLVIGQGLKVPNGIAFRDGDLYVAEMSRILHYRNIEAALPDVPVPEVLYDRLPGESHHGWRYIGFGPDGKLYVSIGAPCNVCDRNGYANISRMNSDGSGFEVFAEGIRNSVGFTWHPQTGELWFTDNGRDMLGDDMPPGELNRAPQRGMHFGFPYCHGGDLKDPEFGGTRSCDEFTSPAQKLGPHVAPLGLVIYDGTMFPEQFRGAVFIAEHGSWNRSTKIGYRIAMVPLRGGNPAGYEVFADGWLQGDDVSGRPVDLLLLRDGSLLVSDDKAGRVFRITYTRPLSAGIAADYD